MKEKQEQFLANLQKKLEGGAVQPEEVVEVVESLLQIVANLQNHLETQMTANHGQASSSYRGLSDNLRELKQDVVFLGQRMVETERDLTKDIDKLLIDVFTECQRISALIPDIPSFEPLEVRITALETKETPVSPETPDTGEDIVDKINDLPDDDEHKIDAKHIKNLPKSTNNSSVGPSVGGSGIRSLTAGQNIAVDTNPYSPKVSLSIPIQSSAPSNPVLNDLWIDNS